MAENEYILKSELDVMGLIHNFSKMKFSDPLVVIWKPYVPKRSINQNALMWKWNEEVSKWLYLRDVKYKGWTKDHVHEMHKHTFLGWETVVYINVETGVRHTQEKLRETKKLDRGEMQEFMEKIYYFWTNKKCFLTVPELSQYFKNQNG